MGVFGNIGLALCAYARKMCVFQQWDGGVKSLKNQCFLANFQTTIYDKKYLG